MTKRRWLQLLLIIPLALVIVVAVAVSLIPTDRIATLAADQASAALDREVRIEGVSLKIFPRPAVSMTGIAVAGRVQDETPVATISRVLLQPRILPLLRKQVVIDAIVLDEPRVLVEIDAESVSNLPLLGGAADSTGVEPETTSSEPASGGALDFLVQRLQINDAHLTYHDARTETRVSIAGLNQRLRLAGDLAGGELQRIALEGEIDIPAISINAPAQLAVPLDSIQLRIAHDASLDLAGDSLSLESLALAIQGLQLEGSGSVLDLSDPEARRVALELGAGPANLAEIMASIPLEAFALKGADGKTPTLPELGGVLEIALRVAGRVGGDSIPEVEGTASLSDFSLGYGELGQVVAGTNGRLAFSLDSLVSDGISGTLLGEPFQLALNVRDLAEPDVKASIKSTVDLGRLGRLLPDSIEAAGRIALDLRADLPVPNPAAGRLDGAIDLQKIRVKAPGLHEAVSVPGARIALAGQRLQISDLGVTLGESDLALDLAISDWLPLALGDTAAMPRVDFQTRSGLLDLDAILGPADTLTYGTLLFARLAERELGGLSATEVAREAGFGLPPIPPMTLRGGIRIGEFRRDGILLNDLVVGLAANGQRLELTDANFKMMGGGIKVAAQVGMPLARLDAETAPTYPVSFTFTVQDVGAAPFFDTFTPFREHLSGTLILAGSGEAVLDEQLLPLRESLRMKGSAAVSDGQLVNWPALQRLGKELSAVGFDTLTFRDWAGNFSISGPRVMLHETSISAGEMGIDAAGSFDFNGTLDLGATLHLSREMTGRLKGDVASRLSAAAAAGDGRVPVGVKVTGTALSPKLKLDFSAAASNLAAKAREEAEKRASEAESKAREAAREAAESAARKAIDRFLPGRDSTGQQTPDSAGETTTAPADSVRAKAEKKVKDKLCGLVKC